jgi:hypothetical protein
MSVNMPSTSPFPSASLSATHFLHPSVGHIPQLNRKQAVEAIPTYVYKHASLSSDLYAALLPSLSSNLSILTRVLTSHSPSDMPSLHCLCWL